jgi:hypothetical protein
MGASAGCNVSIQGLTIQHGTYSGLHVLVEDSAVNLTLDGVIIQNNTTWDMGGGIRLDKDHERRRIGWSEF